MDAKPRPRPTMNDVAAKAGVSQATVSLILNDSPSARFSDATRERVQNAAQVLGYKLDRRPPTTSTETARMILFLVDELASDPWMTQGYEGIREKATETGVEVGLNVARSFEIEQVAKSYSALAPLGIIYGTILTRRITPPPLLLNSPTVLLNCYDEERRIASVLPGDTVGGREATEHLIRQGCKRIAYINGQPEIDASQDRLNGYRQALASHDMAIRDELIRPGNWEPSAGYEQTRALMELPEPPDGIFCANDLMATGCYEALKELGLRIPEDVSVVGFDDREIAQYMRPPLTTLLLPHLEMGRVAAELLLDMVGGIDGRRDQLKVECPLVLRQS